MTKYVVIEVADREINHVTYDNLDMAKTVLRKLYEHICNDNNPDCNDDNRCWISEDGMDAYANINGGYHWDYQDIHWDWKIIEV